jgi:hypothetical protein
MTLRRIGVWSAARVSCALYAAIGLLIGAVISAVSLLATLIGAGSSAAAGPFGGFGGVLFGVGAIVLLPVFYGLIGLVGGALAAAVYNLAARLVGGLELELEGRS